MTTMMDSGMISLRRSTTETIMHIQLLKAEPFSNIESEFNSEKTNHIY